MKTEGDTDRDLYILTRGSVSVKIMLPLSQVFQTRVIGALTENPHISLRLHRCIFIVYIYVACNVLLSIIFKSKCSNGGDTEHIGFFPTVYSDNTCRQKKKQATALIWCGGRCYS